MKFYYSIIATTTLVALSACGGGNKSDGNGSDTDGAKEKVEAHFEIASAPDNALSEMGNYLSFADMPGTIDVDDSEITLTVYPKIIQGTDSLVLDNREATMSLLDANGKELLVIYTMGGWTDLNEGLLSGNTAFNEKLYVTKFMDSPEEALEVAKNAAFYQANFPLISKALFDERNAQNSGNGDEESDSEEQADTTPAPAASVEDFVVVPKSLQVTGNLKDYITIQDKQYKLEEKMWYDDPWYPLDVTFDIVKTVTLPEKSHVSLNVKFYDAQGKLLHFSQMFVGKDPSSARSKDDFDTNQGSLLKKALADGGNTTIQFDIQSWFILNFNVDMIKKMKYFTVDANAKDDMGRPISL